VDGFLKGGDRKRKGRAALWTTGAGQDSAAIGIVEGGASALVCAPPEKPATPMALRDDLERLTPALRRCAHALCAGPDAIAAGDELVRETLRRAAGEPPPADRRPEVWLIGLLVEASRAARTRPGPGVAPARPEPRARGYAERVVEALAALPAEPREALVLVAVARLDYGEAARALGVTQPQLMARLTVARDQFAAIFGGRDDAPGAPRRAPHLRVVK
jgi:RNA polymerase sigma-70 factor (ECF subfamily)